MGNMNYPITDSLDLLYNFFLPIHAWMFSLLCLNNQ